MTKLKDERDAGERQRQRKAIIDMVSGYTRLHSKRELIEKFIQDNLPNVQNPEDITEQFSAFWWAGYDNAMQRLCAEERLKQLFSSTYSLSGSRYAMT